MRRNRKVMATVASVFVVACSACSGDEPVAKTNSGMSTASTTPDTPFPVTIEHRYGTTTIDEPPVRIVTLGRTDQDALLALGIVPVGTTQWFGQHAGAIWPWARDELAALQADTGAAVPTVVGNATAIDFDAVAALKPDLILAIAAGLDEAEYLTLVGIAPTVAQPDAFVDFAVPWDEQTRIIGRAVGRADQAEAAVQAVEAQLDGVRQANPAFAGATAVVAQPNENGARVYAPPDPRAALLSDLGFRQPPDVARIAGTNPGVDLRIDQLGAIDGDVAVFIVNSVERDRARFDAALSFVGLSLANAGRIVYVENLSALGGATSFVTVLSVPFLLEELAPQLAIALDGNPTTTP